MLSLGNAAVNSIYEAKMDAAKDLTKPQPDSSQPVRDSWIQAKYVKKLFVDHSWNGGDELEQETPLFSESGRFCFWNVALRSVSLIIGLVTIQGKWMQIGCLAKELQPVGFHGCAELWLSMPTGTRRLAMTRSAPPSI